METKEGVAAAGKPESQDDSAQSRAAGKDGSAEGKGSKSKEDKERHKEKGSSLSEYWEEDGKKYNLACEEGSRYEKLAEDSLELKSGVFLIEAEGDISLKTPTVLMKLGRHSMILVRILPGQERVFCLLESVVLGNPKLSWKLNCGDEALLQDHELDRGGRDITGEFDVAVRSIRATDLGDNWRIIFMEYSILQAIEREPLLHQISHSKHSHDRLLRNRLLKAVAAIQIFAGRHQRYQNREAFLR